MVAHILRAERLSLSYCTIPALFVLSLCLSLSTSTSLSQGKGAPGDPLLVRLPHPAATCLSLLLPLATSLIPPLPSLASLNLTTNLPSRVKKKIKKRLGLALSLILPPFLNPDPGRQMHVTTDRVDPDSSFLSQGHYDKKNTKKASLISALNLLKKKPLPPSLPLFLPLAPLGAVPSIEQKKEKRKWFLCQGLIHRHLRSPMGNEDTTPLRLPALFSAGRMHLLDSNCRRFLNDTKRACISSLMPRFFDLFFFIIEMKYTADHIWDAKFAIVLLRRRKSG